MTHAVIYDRASTILQKDNFSRVNAKTEGIRIAEREGFTWEYVKEIGSGTTLTGRPKMMRILDRIAAGEVQVLIVQDLDRLARPEEYVVYATIRQTIMRYGVIIYTHTSRVDLNNDDDDFVADITMSVAKKERRRILKRIRRGKKARAESGKFTGGFGGLGYTIVGSGSDSDFTVDSEGARLVKLIFDTLEAMGGNLLRAAKRLNDLGKVGYHGKAFTANSVGVIAKRKLYIGIFESSFVTDKVMHRPDLQIISIDQFERVQKLIKSRAGNSRESGRRGKYIFTGFVICGGCGGPMAAANRRKRIVYQCINRRRYGAAACNKSNSYTEHLILPPIVDFLTELIQSQINFHNDLDEAANQYGKSITEEALEAAIKGELASVRAGKQRLVEAISLGVLTTEEAAAKLNELREQEQRLTVEIAGVAEKTAMLEEWQQALNVLKRQSEKGIADRLYFLAKEQPVAFRQLLGMVFEPNSLKVSTSRIEGNRWAGYLDNYCLTEAMEAMKRKTVSFVNTQ